MLDTSGSASRYKAEAKAFITTVLQHYVTNQNNVDVALVTTNDHPAKLEWDFIDTDTALAQSEDIIYAGNSRNLETSTYEYVSSIINQNDPPIVIITVVDELDDLDTNLRDSVPLLQTQTVL